MFVDETGTNTKMVRLYGRAPKGQRVIGKQPWGHWKTTTFVAGLRIGELSAPFLLDGAMNREAFETYVEKVLAPTLSDGDVVIMDNLAAHKGSKVRQLIERAGARLLLLPPYSPDLNPIERLFAKFKALLRKAAERTIPALWQRIGLSQMLHTSGMRELFPKRSICINLTGKCSRSSKLKVDINTL